jgi:LmbE family N-acetylglucosaminyl deacetylase
MNHAFRGKTVLAIFAHPDDESLACGGTLARLADEGARVVLLCASRGERGGLTGPVRDDALGARRAAELADAAEVLGVHDLILFNHPDGDLRWADVTRLGSEIVFTVRRFLPDAVITFGDDGLYWHVDHIGIHERTIAAMRVLGGADAPPLYFVTMPQDVMPSIVEQAVACGWTAPPKGFWSLAPRSFGLGAREPTLVVDVADWAPRKLAAIRCHRTQTAGDDPFGKLSAEQTRRWLGVEHFHRSAADAAKPPVLELLNAHDAVSNP